MMLEVPERFVSIAPFACLLVLLGLLAERRRAETPFSEASLVDPVLRNG
jgi:hypothetical protein